MEALTICLECNNSVFDTVFYLQQNGTSMRSQISCSNSDIVMYRFNIQASNCRSGVQCWKRFRDGIFRRWNYFLEELENIFEFMNNIDTTDKIKFAMSVANESVQEFLDLSFDKDQHKKDLCGCLCKDSKHFYVFTLLPSTCYPMKK